MRKLITTTATAALLVALAIVLPGTALAHHGHKHRCPHSARADRNHASQQIGLPALRQRLVGIDPRVEDVDGWLVALLEAVHHWSALDGERASR